jgi:hypothetical protein
MPGTSSIYEEPSRLSQGLVVGLSIAVVAMAGWFVATIALSPPSATVAVEGDTDATAGGAPVTVPTDGTAASAAADTARQPLPPSPEGSVFDWPRFPSASPPPKAALPLAPEVPATRDAGSLWPVAVPAKEARNEAARSDPSRGPRQPGATPEATDAIVDVLAPAPPSRNAGSAAQPQRQTQRRQKPRAADSDAAQ